jgi:hypothetical protein
VIKPAVAQQSMGASQRDLAVFMQSALAMAKACGASGWNARDAGLVTG